MTKTIKVESWQEVPENFTGIILLESADVKHRTASYYLKDGKFHRENGPALEWIDRNTSANNITLWYLNGERLTEEQHKLLMMSSEESRQKLYENNNKGLKNLLAI